MPDGNVSAFQACVRTPFATLGISATDTHVTGIRFLAPLVRAFAPRRNTIAFLACVQIQAYLDDPRYRFDMPLRLGGTRHRIVAAGGSLGGFMGARDEGFELGIKRWLLEHEGAL